MNAQSLTRGNGTGHMPGPAAPADRVGRVVGAVCGALHTAAQPVPADWYEPRRSAYIRRVETDAVGAIVTAPGGERFRVSVTPL